MYKVNVYTIPYTLISRGDKWVYRNLLAKKLTLGQISIFGQVTTSDKSLSYADV